MNIFKLIQRRRNKFNKLQNIILDYSVQVCTTYLLWLINKLKLIIILMVEGSAIYTVMSLKLCLRLVADKQFSVAQ